MRVRCGQIALVVLLSSSLPSCGKTELPSVPVPVNTAAPATLADLSATLTSPENGRDLNCREDLHALITLTNRAARLVQVNGVFMTSEIVSGSCTTSPESSYQPRVAQVFTNSSAVVLDQALFNNGTGCCRESGCSGSKCGVKESFRVSTEAGDVPAGSLTYTVTFSGCATCTTTAGAGIAGCTRDAP